MLSPQVKSEFHRRAVVEAAPGVAARCTVVPNGVDETEVREVKAEIEAEIKAECEAAAEAAAEAAVATVEAAVHAVEAGALGHTERVHTRSPLPAPPVPRRPPSAELVYTSSYDRGLEEQLRHGWPLIHAALPHARLHRSMVGNVKCPFTCPAPVPPRGVPGGSGWR